MLIDWNEEKSDVEMHNDITETYGGPASANYTLMMMADGVLRICLIGDT